MDIKNAYAIFAETPKRKLKQDLQDVKTGKGIKKYKNKDDFFKALDKD